tara:strand:+ start:3362 stop:4423 length:1062 start_codon:yes stop_codon:yes gene_type:complete
MINGVLKNYKDFLDISPATPDITLGEGSTPLVKSRHIAAILGCKDLYFKLEGCNPTGSFKDRGMVVAVAKAIEAGSKAIICASTGNTSASAAAYGAYCGLKTIVLIPSGRISGGKMAQALAYNPKILSVDGTFDQALATVRELTKYHNITLVNSVNPDRIDGQKTAAFEIIDDIEKAPDYVALPVGNAGNITAYWKGFKEYLSAGITMTTPKLMGFQAEGAAPIVEGRAIDSPKTIASAIRIGNPASWDKAVNARDESDGIISSVSDQEIMDAYKLLASKEGIFAEPASAASVAGVMKLSRKTHEFENKTVVCVITGNGLKDPDIASEYSGTQLEEITVDVNTISGFLKEVIA